MENHGFWHTLHIFYMQLKIQKYTQNTTVYLLERLKSFFLQERCCYQPVVFVIRRSVLSIVRSPRYFCQLSPPNLIPRSANDKCALFIGISHQVDKIHQNGKIRHSKPIKKHSVRSNPNYGRPGGLFLHVTIP